MTNNWFSGAYLCKPTGLLHSPYILKQLCVVLPINVLSGQPLNLWFFYRMLLRTGSGLNRMPAASLSFIERGDVCCAARQMKQLNKQGIECIGQPRRNTHWRRLTEKGERCQGGSKTELWHDALNA